MSIRWSIVQCDGTSNNSGALHESHLIDDVASLTRFIMLCQMWSFLHIVTVSFRCVRRLLETGAPEGSIFANIVLKDTCSLLHKRNLEFPCNTIQASEARYTYTEQSTEPQRPLAFSLLLNGYWSPREFPGHYRSPSVRPGTSPFHLQILGNVYILLLQHSANSPSVRNYTCLNRVVLYSKVRIL